MSRLLSFIFHILALAGFVLMVYGLFNGRNLEQIFKYFLLGHILRSIYEVYSSVLILWYNIFGFPETPDIDDPNGYEKP